MSRVARPVLDRLVFICFIAAMAATSSTFAGKMAESVAGLEARQSFRISFDDASPLRADVEARIAVKDGSISMTSWGASHMPNGWGSFVGNLRISDDAGKEIQYDAKPNAAWQLRNVQGGFIKLSYQVDLSFTRTEWPAGNEQAGVFQDGALFLVTKALFIVSDDSSGYDVRFDVPAGWKVSTPWPHAAVETGFVAVDKDDLLNNSVVLGKHTEYVFKEGNFTFTLALLGRTKAARHLIAPTLQKTLHSFIRIFDKTAPTKYLMTVFYADAADAEAYRTSAAFTERDELTRENLIRWGNTVAHELFHSWNGHAIRGENYESIQWFSEGFTEYYANLALVREQLITDELFIKKMENHLGLYLYFNVSPAFDGTSLKRAGERKTRYRLGVYSGGWAAAFCLDVIIRDETRGRKSLDDMMRLMHERFGLTLKKYSYDDLITAASEIAGRDMSDFFKKYIEGREQLPVIESLKGAAFDGYTQYYDGEMYIRKSQNATARQFALRRSLLSDN